MYVIISLNQYLTYGIEERFHESIPSLKTSLLFLSKGSVTQSNKYKLKTHGFSL